MVIYGKENPLVYTPQEIFNPTTAQMELNVTNQYIQALREDYKDSIAKQDQFLKDYGNFISPSAVDTERWYDATTGGIGRMLQEAQNRGIDLLRSVEGRSLIQKYIATRPYSQLANMRESAKNLEKYVDAIGTMRANNTYNEDLERINGIPDYRDWDSSKGIWLHTSPIKYQTEDEMIDPVLKDMKDSFISKKDGFITTGVSADDIRKMIHDHIDDILDTPNGKLLVDKYKSREAAEEALIQRGMKWKRTNVSADPIYQTKLSADLSDRNAKRAEERAIQHQKDMVNFYLSNGLDSKGKPIKKDEDLPYNYLEHSKESAMYQIYGNDLSAVVNNGTVSTEGLLALQERKLKEARKEYGTWRMSALGLAHNADASDFYVRLSQDERSVYTKNGARITIGIMGAPKEILQRLVTTQDISTVMARSANNNKNYARTKVSEDPQYNGYSWRAMYAIGGNPYGENLFPENKDFVVETAVNKVRDIRPISGSKSMITGYTKDGTLHQYQKVDVTTTDNKHYEMWYDHGDINAIMNTPSGKSINMNWLSDHKQGFTKTGAPDGDEDYSTPWQQFGSYGQ